MTPASGQRHRGRAVLARREKAEKNLIAIVVIP
jgi:hypothetical protein